MRRRRYRSPMGFNPERGTKPRASDYAIVVAAAVLIGALLVWGFGLA